MIIKVAFVLIAVSASGPVLASGASALAFAKAEQGNLNIETLNCALLNQLADVEYRENPRSKKANADLDKASHCRSNLKLRATSIASRLKVEVSSDSEKMAAIKSWFLFFSAGLRAMPKAKDSVALGGILADNYSRMVDVLTF